MRSRRWMLALLATAMVPVPTAVAALADRADVHATLIRVDVFEPAKGGRGGPPTSTTANCGDDGATSSDQWAWTGWRSAGGTAHLNASTVPTALGDVSAQLQAAFDVWGSRPSVPDFDVVADGSVTKPTANRGTDLMFGRVSGNAIAVTYTWRWSDGLVESDTAFNKSVPWSVLADDGTGCLETQPYYDVANIAAHEFGHIYGLDHPSGGRFETMYRYAYTGETLKRSLGAGDIAGVDGRYAVTPAAP